MNRKKVAAAQEEDPKNRKLLTGDFIPEDAHAYRLIRPSFTVYVGGDPSSTPEEEGEPGVDHHMADRFEINMSILSGISPTRPILVKMASGGGNWEEGMQIFSAILHSPNPVTVLATKWARSMTSIIPLAADRFVIQAPAQYMIHKGTYSFSGLEQEIDTADIERRKAMEMMTRIYIARLREQGMHSGLSDRRIRSMLQENYNEKIDVWFSADEAVARGFADAVYDGNPRTLRAAKKNVARRAMFMEVLRRPITVDTRVS